MSRRRVFIALVCGWTVALSAAGPPAPPGFQSFALSVPQSNKVGFTLLSPATTGIQFTNFLSEQRHLTNQILLNGSGVALGDADGDGRCDVYLCRLGGPNALYRNLGD